MYACQYGASRVGSDIHDANAMIKGGATGGGKKKRRRDECRAERQHCTEISPRMEHTAGCAYDNSGGMVPAGTTTSEHQIKQKDRNR